PGPLPVTVAVNVTLWAAADGLTEETTAVVLLALFTVCVRVPLLPAKVESPPYDAGMTWLPPARVGVVKEAVVVPALVDRLPCPMLVAPSEKITSPLGLPAPLPVTVAVKVTLWPQTEGLAEETTTVVLLLLPTVCVSAPVLALKFPSPLYDAVIV